MFGKIAEYFIKNSKLTFVIILTTIIAGIVSYIVIPKQFNPTIIQPAFQVEILTYGLNADQVENQIISPVEDLIMELEGVEEVWGYAFDNYAGLAIKFRTGIDNEDAKIRVLQKLEEIIKQKPDEIGTPTIKNIDVENLPQITYAIYYSGSEELSLKDQQIYLRNIANIVKSKTKSIDNVTSVEIIGGMKKNIYVHLNLDEIEARNSDVLEVYKALANYNINSPIGDIREENRRIFLDVNSKIENIEELKKIVISNHSDSPLYLEDIATIEYGTQNIKEMVRFSDENGDNEAILIGFAKEKGSNAVVFTNNIIKKVDEIKKELPKDIGIEVVQNEGKTANDSTNKLILNLIEGFLIVTLILGIFLGIKDGLNSAVAIPIVLLLTFLVAFAIGDNINKITLFALILVVGMVVDNSIVIVENISRHLNEEKDSGKDVIKIISDAVNEVGIGVIMSTLTKLIAFAGMFTVTGLMGQYVGPIPKYLIIALSLSILVCFIINPWLSYIIHKNLKSEKTKTSKKFFDKFDIRNAYVKLMKKFIGESKSQSRNRKIFKILFIPALILVIFLPVYFGVFRSLMLPKMDQDVIYLWIDTPRDYKVEQTLEIEKETYNFFFKNDNLDEDLKIVENFSSTLGVPYMGDISNLMRLGGMRKFENQISARIDLYDPKDYKKETGKERMISPDYIVKIRNEFEDYMLSKYPDLKIRFLEAPPGPPTKSAFLLMIKSQASEENLEKFSNKVYSEVYKIKDEYDIVDLYTSKMGTYQKITLDIDNISASKAGISSEQIKNTLGIIYSGVQMFLVDDKDSSEQVFLYLDSQKDFTNSIDELKNISFTNSDGVKIPLESIASINYSYVHDTIESNKREITNSIYGEIGDNSIIYPCISLIRTFLSEDFLGEDYKLVSWNPYEMTFRGASDGQIYKIEFGGEWVFTVDVFRDMGIVLGVSLLIIYFLLVGQFGSFSVALILMIPFVLSFFGIMPGFSLLYVMNGTYFSATGFIGIIMLGGIVVGNSIVLVDYLNTLRKNSNNGLDEDLIQAGFVRFIPILMTSLSTIFGSLMIVGDIVWTGVAWSIVFGLTVSCILTLIVVPIYYYDNQKKIM